MIRLVRTPLCLCALFALLIVNPVLATAAILMLWSKRGVVFPIALSVVWLASAGIAPQLGRVALPCSVNVLRSQSLLYCAAQRNYVTPELLDVANAAAERVNEAYPGTVTLTFDGSLPLFDGLPLIPHLSHDDGEKLDFAFYYTNTDGLYLPGKTRSILGYWAFENTTTDCPRVRWSLRWDLEWLQVLWPDRRLDAARTAALIAALADDPRVTKIFVEPGLAKLLGLTGAKIRFQGCRAARHDDHIHVQL